MLIAEFDLFVLTVGGVDLTGLCNASLKQVEENCILFFSCGASTRFQIMVLTYGASRSQPYTPHLVELVWTSDQPDAEASPDNTQHSQETNIHASLGFEPTISNRAAADPRLRPRGQWDRRNYSLDLSFTKCNAVHKTT
jgi:hypothetical protein